MHLKPSFVVRDVQGLMVALFVMVYFSGKYLK